MKAELQAYSDQTVRGMYMLCPKCGNEIEDGLMYCPKCGEEIRIVPDFEPEIEQNIEDTLYSVAMEVDDKESDESPLDEIVENEAAKSIPKPVLFAIAGFFFVLVCCLGIMIYNDNSAPHQVKLGDKAYAAGNTKNALNYYKKAVSLDPDNSDYSMKLADCYLDMENPDQAIEVYKSLVLNDPDSTLAYAQIISIYESSKRYDDIAEFLAIYATDNIKESFLEYTAPDPIFGTEGGDYDEAVILTISDTGHGKVHYTDDGTIPSKDSPEYNAPIMLKKGEHVIQALFVNEYGAESNIVKNTYNVLAEAPTEPIVSLESGDYDKPQLIKVIVPDDCNVYYTFDGTDPNSLSHIYGEPISIPEGASTYKFVAINSKGIASEIVQCDYNLTIESMFSKEDGLNILVNRLVQIGYLVDTSGTLANFPGKYIYLFGEVRMVNGISMYCYNEYYATATTSRDMTSNIFGVDIMTGNVYMVNKGINGVYSIRLMQ